MKDIATLVIFCNYFCFFIFINGSQNFNLLAVLNCPAVHFVCMDILGGWVPDRLLPRRLFELVAAI